jgi:sugar lactone lactonase YvrE
MKTITKFVYTAFAAFVLAIGALSANGAPGHLFASINAPGNGSASIYQYTPSGVQSTFVSGLSRPRGLAFDSVGNLFVATTFCFFTCESTILKITPNGTQSTFATFATDLFAEGVLTDGADNVFVDAIDIDDRRFASTIFEFAPDGTQSTFGSVPGQSFGPALDSAGNLYVPCNVCRTIYKFTPDGTRSVFVRPSAFTHDQGPLGLAFDGFGNLFVSTTNGAILKFTPEGVESTFATGLNDPLGLAFDRAGNLFVTEGGNTPPGDILKFTPDGVGTVFAAVSTGVNSGPEFLAFQPR